MIWAQGDGSMLSVYDTPFGKISGLICFENYMPLARYALYAWGTQIYVAATVARVRTGGRSKVGDSRLVTWNVIRKARGGGQHG
jgi:predicted amidohydrolase